MSLPRAPGLPASASVWVDNNADRAEGIKALATEAGLRLITGDNRYRAGHWLSPRVKLGQSLLQAEAVGA